ncbi:MAG TPA: DUF429 domain-containing protein [Ktedonobacteraceae bacterium]|nr:DUF429 domain-containing protein [Ktedonobacteraceae bacterium]
MRIFGIDFTSAPSRRKPITCALCTLHDEQLTLLECLTLPTLEEFEIFLRCDGPWCAAFDFPFGLPRLLLANLGWPRHWEDYMQLVATQGRTGFEETITCYCASQPPGQKHLLRATDTLAKSRSPMMLHRVPVGKMFFQGAPRLLQSGVSILPCRPTSDSRVALEGYPALVARRYLGSRSYKSDERSKQTGEKLAARRELVQALRSPALSAGFGLTLTLPDPLAAILISNPMADLLDALLCAIQSAWAYTRRADGYGIPRNCDSDEGWIVDPGMMV